MGFSVLRLAVGTRTIVRIVLRKYRGSTSGRQSHSTPNPGPRTGKTGCLRRNSLRAFPPPPSTTLARLASPMIKELTGDVVCRRNLSYVTHGRPSQIAQIKRTSRLPRDFCVGFRVFVEI